MRLLKDESGVALVYVVVVMAVVFLLVSGIITVSMHENIQSLYQSEEMMAYYVSRAGAEAMVLELKRMDKTRYEQFGSEQLAEGVDVLFVGDSVDVSVEKNGNYYDIESIGTYKTHTATTRIRMEYVERYDFDYAAYAYDDMGTSAPNGEISIKEIVGGLGSGGNIYVKDADVGPGKAIPEDEIIPNYQHEIDIVVPDLSGITIDPSNEIDNPNTNLLLEHSSQITNLSMSNKTITVDTSNADYDKDTIEDYDTVFTLSQVSEGSGDWMVLRLPDRASLGGGLIIEGNNNLMIIVEDAFHLSDGITINDDDGDSTYAKVEIYVMDTTNDDGDDFTKTGGNNGDYDMVFESNDDFGLDVDGLEHLKIYLHGEVDDNEVITVTNTLAMNNNSNLYGYILGPEATVDLKNGQTSIYGSVYANIINFEASVSIENPNSYVSSDAIYKEMQIAYWE